ncbi:hypothetical protein R3W88_011731 [Solanum pinnatisectum]|uniref:Uncharacterized protein n=1 Tax=Solanum pinnatisectum TaxID=50273 RepID=A0AAV9L8B2_9SOLN|nr:hypothetical protein R3W88_011731 [Solanum pinnatisectum]
MSWMVGGDFNVILGDEEKIGGLPVYPHEYEDFALYRVVVNDSFLESYGNTGLQHLSRTGSDHAPLLFTCGVVTFIFLSLSSY